MFGSIRRRLVASYVLLTLLTVGTMGALMLSLVRRYGEQRAVEFLTTNAQAVADQAVPLVRSEVPPSALEHLARSTAFLIDARVRILDGGERVLADSGPPLDTSEMVWIAGDKRVGAVAAAPVEAGVAPFVVRRLGGMFHLAGPGFPRSGMATISSTIAITRSLGHDADVLMFSVPAAAVGTADAAPALPADGAWLPFERPVGLDQAPSDLLPAAPAAGHRFEARFVAIADDRVIRVPIGQSGSTVGFVEVSQGPDIASDAVVNTHRAFGFAAGAALLVACFVGLVVSRSLTAPLRDLAGAAADAEGGDLTSRATVRGGDEIAQVARQFNAMAERLQASFAELAEERDALRRFIADASHELRTPITALKSFNELLQSAAVDDPAVRTEFLAESGAQIERLAWITRNLLDLSRFDAGLVQLDVAEVPVGDVLAAVAGALRPTALSRGISLEVAMPIDPTMLRCDRTRVELALTNLVDNALKFSARGGRVVVGGRIEDGEVRLWVGDDGPGIPDEDRPHIFDRFYRGRQALPDDHAAGSGLGLAIVQSVMQVHHGRIEVECEPGTGSRFTLCFP